DLGRILALVLEAAQTQAALQPERDLGLHVGELLLDQLVRGEWPAELLAVESVLTRRVPAEFRGAQGAPRDAVARVIETTERPLQALDAGQPVFLGDEDIVEDDLAGDRGAQTELAFDLRGRKPFHSFFQNEA